MVERKEPTQIEKNIDKLKKLLSELFQFESSDLDFGIYRIINQKQTLIRKYIDKELVESISRQCADINATSEETAEIFDHIYQFFSRYYDKGDYMPLHRHSLRDKKYAVPWNGEEVVLHWANKDQYYIKTGGNFKDFIFRDEENKFRIHFTIIDSQEPANNVKQEDHYFILSGGADAVVYDDSVKDLTCKFTYEPLTKEEAKRRSGATSDPQKTFRISAEKRITELLEIMVKEEKSTARKNNILTLLGILDKKERRKTPSAEDASTPTFLGKKLNRYVQENKSDYFIHKDLGGFLRQELDTYIKREMWDLDDLIGTAKGVPDPSHLKAYSDRIRIMRNISLEIITFLAQIEDFQRRLFEKKKFVLSADYCITLDHIPKKFYKQILENEDQIAEWKKLFGIGDTGEQSTLSGNKIDEQYLDEHQFLVLDTKFFPLIKENLIDSLQNTNGKSIDDFDELIGGVIIKSENWQALNLLLERYRDQINCIYIDPPYNTQKDTFLYKDRYKHSSWMSMISDRIQISNYFLNSSGVFFASIDRNEVSNLDILLSDIYGSENSVGEIVWRNARDNNPTQIAIEHEYILCYAQNKSKAETVWKNEFADSKNLLLNEYERLKKSNLSLNVIQEKLREFIKDNIEIMKEVDRYKFVDENGVYTGSQSVHNPHPAGYEYEILHPITQKPMRTPANGYRFPFETLKNDYIDKDRIIYGPDENRIIQIKLYLKDYQDSLRSVIDLDGRLGAYSLNSLFGQGKYIFDNPKPPQLIDRILSFGSSPNTIILDFFAGSGCTAHSVFDLIKQTNVNMKYILIEMADYFDSIMKPHIEKLMFASDWKDGKPVPGSKGQSHIFKYMVLEQYEDTLNNIAFAQKTLDVSAYDDYLIQYMLDFETKESPCRFGITTITDPWAYQLKVYDENVPRTQNVDLIETFNYLLGIHVKGYRTFTDGKNRYRVVIGSKNEAVILVIWRKMQDLDLTTDKEFVENTILPEIRSVCKRSPEKIYINAEFYVKDALPIEPEFFGCMGG